MADPYHTDDVMKARAQRDALMGELQNQQPRQAPQVAPTTLGPTAQAGPVNVGQAQQTTAAQAGAVSPVGTRYIPPTQQVQARTFEDVRLPGAQQAQAQTAAAQQAGAVNATAAAVDPTQQGQVRGQQQQLNSALLAAGFGTGGPSAAEQTMAQSTDRAIAAQRALAAGARGTGHVTAGLTAANNVAQLTQEGARQASILRAQEQQAARGQAIGALEGTRGADIGLATTNAGFQQQAGLQNASLGTQVALQNAKLGTDAALQNATLGTQTSQFNAGQGNQMAQQQGQLTQQEREANQRAALSADLANQGVEAQRQTTMSQQDLQAALANQGVAAANNQFNAGQTNQVGVANTAASNRMAELQAQIDSQQGIANSAQSNEMARLQGQLNAQTGQFNVDAMLKERGLDDQQRAAIMAALQGQQGQVLDWDKAVEALNAQKRGQTLGFVGGLFGAAGSVGAAAAGAPPA